MADRGAVPRPVDPAVGRRRDAVAALRGRWERPAMRSALARRDIGLVYRLLAADGMALAQISDLTGQARSEVSAIAAGRPVCMVPLLERIADRLGIPRGYLGLAYSETPTYRDQGRFAAFGDGVDDDVKRRAFLAAASAAVVGRPVLGEALALAQPAADPAAPARLVAADVTALRALTERFRELGRTYGGMFDVLGPVATKADRLLGASGPGHVERALRQALADLHELAGWTAYDVGLADRARYHYDRAIRLAGEVDDPLRMISTVQHAAIADREDGAPDSALRLYQVATAKLLELPGADPRVPVKRAWLHLQMARCYTLLDRPEHARKELALTQALPRADDRFERADMTGLHARVALALGELDAAHQHALTSVQTWGHNDRRDGALSLITLATVHVTSGERDATTLAATALDAVEPLRSVRARSRLAPLEHALRARGDSASVDLAQRAEQLRRDRLPELSAPKV